MSNKQKVIDLLKSIETGNEEPVGYIHPAKYVQHNLGVADGLAGFGALLQALPTNSARVNTIRAFEDGDFVAAHTEYNFFGPKAGFDIFRFEDGLIVGTGIIFRRSLPLIHPGTPSSMVPSKSRISINPR
jgi:predicted SnoaL-like aldol condensation-catalyzing enzyme